MSDTKINRFELLAHKYVTSRCEELARPLYHGGRYFEWDGTRYREIEHLEMHLRSWLRKSNEPQDNRVIANTVPIIKNLGFLPALENVVLPTWQPHDALPDPLPEPTNVVAFKNGLLDVSQPDRGLIPHSPLWLSTSCLPFGFDPTARCPAWLTFLDAVYEGDPDRIGLLQEWSGYLMSQDTSHQKMLLMVGLPRSGKGTIHRMLTDLIGDGATGYRLPLLASQFGLSPLLSKTAAFVPEVELSGRGDKAEISETLKAIIGEDAMCVNRKGLPLLTARLRVRFTVAANTIPTLWDSSSALGQRMLVLEHRKSFLGREEVALGTRLGKELPGVATWAFEGLRRLQARGRFPNGGDPELTRRLALQSSPVRVFVAERLVVSKWADPGLPGLTLTEDAVEVRRDKLFDAYQQWATDHDADTSSPTWFARDLRAVLPGIKDGWVNDKRAYLGIGLLDVGVRK